MARTLIVILIAFCACNSSDPYTNKSFDNSVVANERPKSVSVIKESPKEAIQKDQLLGAWTDGSTENATFNIGKDSIFYVDEMTSFPYTLKGDSLAIDYPDMSFRGTAKFSGDTLILSDQELGTTRFTRFAN